jgi:hypothetical protein
MSPVHVLAAAWEGVMLAPPPPDMPVNFHEVYTVVGALPGLKRHTKYWILMDNDLHYHALTPAEVGKIAEEKNPEFEHGYILFPTFTLQGWEE